ncbi:hypothetical protein [Lactobacillus sp. HT06-2]|uniref:hypothetical protein n=1 Tax=Lactobacillus sp. HT06-2 TaxID=2080222 RepID=UPI000CD8EBB5|nr:hypothetical protein [Lactobacillus sp. HT06-2]
MALDHMLYNVKKWVKTLVGSTVYIPFTCHLYQLNDFDMQMKQRFSGKQNQYQIIGAKVYYAVEFNNQIFYLDKDEILQIGGQIAS